MILKEKPFYHKLYAAFFALFPAVEIYRSFFGDTLSLGPLAIEEILVMLAAGVLFAAGLGFAFKEKSFVRAGVAIGYFAVAAVYTILHARHILSFNTSVFPSAAPSFFTESYYLVRMYFLPISLLFSALLLKVPYKTFLKGMKICVLILSAAVVLTDLTGLSFASYADGQERVAGGFFAWFTLKNDADFALYTAKGPFLSANDIGSLLFAAAPLTVLSFWQEKKKRDLALVALQMVAMVMIGTKVAAFGFGLAFVAVGGAYLLERAIAGQRKGNGKAALCALVLLVLYVPLLLVSPGYRMQKNVVVQRETEDRDTSSVQDISDIVAEAQSEPDPVFTEEEILAMEEYMEAKHWYHYINPWFLEIYPVRGDMVFWSNIVSRENKLNQSNRTFKIELIARIVERNDNSGDALWGIGYTSGVPYTERDFYFQYYLYGAVGIAVLLLPFFAAALWGAASILKKLFAKKAFSVPAALFFGVVFYFATAYAAGHVFDTLINTYFLAGLSGMLCQSLNRGNEEES